jgi:elongation factor G
LPPRPPIKTGTMLSSGGGDDDFPKDAKETITRPADGEGKFIRQTGRGHYGHILIKVEPNGRGKENVILCELRNNLIPDEFVQAAIGGIRVGLECGVLNGPPIVDVIIRIVGGSVHEIDSNVLAFKMAGIFALKDAVKKADPIIIK